jgi:hypothetical protein
MILTDEEFTRKDLEPMVKILEEREAGNREAEYIRKKIATHSEINDRARAYIDEHGLTECCSLAHVMAKTNGKLAFVVEVGYQMGGRMGVASYLNSLAESAIKNGDLESAVMMRVFAICSYEYVIQHVENEDIDEIITEMYSMTIDNPTNEQWDMARATLLINETETEFLWEESQEEKNDDELD